MRRGVVLMLLLMSVVGPAAVAIAGAVREEDPGYQRVKSIAVALRCPVCQGESVYDSHATVANQMKSIIREQVAAGKSDEEIIAFFVERYGEFVLMQPRATARTALVWLFPAIAFLGGTALVVLMLRRRVPIVPRPAAARSNVSTADLINHIERLEP